MCALSCPKHLQCLLTIIFSLFLPSVTAEKILPPPLPESKWVDRTHLNYTLLHENYASDFLCMYYPSGVYGFWPMVRYLHFISGLPPTGFSLYLLYQNILAFNECPAYGLNKHIYNMGMLGNVAAGFWAGGNILITFGALPRCSFFQPFGAFNLIIGAILQFFFVSWNYVIVLWSLGIEKFRFIPPIDRVNPLALLMCCLPLLLAYVFVFVVAILWGLVSAMRKQNWNAAGDACTIAMGSIIVLLQSLIPMVFLLYFSTGSVKIGNIIGDPWGAYGVSDWVGIADVSVAVTVLVIQMISLCFVRGGEESEPD